MPHLTPNSHKLRITHLKHLARVSVTMVAIVVVSFATAWLSALNNSREAVARYVSVWEEEVARNLLLKDDSKLFDKIKLQILDVAPDVASAEAPRVSVTCLGEQEIEITLYGTPAGRLTVCRSPERLFAQSALSPLFAFGLVLGLLVQTLTLRRRAREERIQLQAQADLIRARSLKEQARQVAHDIRGPLAALKAVLPTIHGTKPEASDLLNKATNRISVIADELLAQARAESVTDTPSHTPATTDNGATPAKTTSNAKPASLEESVRAVIQEIRAATPKNLNLKINMRVSGTKTKKDHTTAIPSAEIERALSNLLTNAVEATRDVKNPRVEVALHQADDRTEVTITDNGIGIAPEVLPHLGEPGFTYGKTGGSGLGISSSKRMLSARGGRLAISSQQGRGTEVRLEIPRA